MQKTKITVKVSETLLKSFNQKLEDCFIKRDAFLNHMIKLETEHLAKDLKGLRMSNPARRYISGELQRLGTKTINVVVDKETAEKLNSIINESNMVRDSFINRLILLLNASDSLLEALDLPTEINDRSLLNSGSMSTSPMNGISTIVYDPLFYLRIAIEEEHEKRLYKFELPNVLVGMTCFIDDINVPGTQDYIKQQNKEDEYSDLMKTLL